MSETNNTLHEQRALCCRCGSVITREPGKAEWDSYRTGFECFLSDEDDNPGAHEPIAVVDRPTEIESTVTPSTLPLPPPVHIPRFTPPGK